MPPLKNLRHEQFVQLYFADPEKNAERAYLAAGFKVKTAKDKSTSCSACSSRLLADARVKQRLAELIERQQRRFDISADRVMRELGRIAFSDVRQVFDQCGAIEDPRQLDDETAAAVAAVEVEKLFEGKGPDRKHIGYTQKLKLWDKNAALNALAKHFKLLGDGSDESGSTYNFHFYIPLNQRDHAHGSNGHGQEPVVIGNGHGE